MKKVLVLGLACTLFLTGCGGKKLECSMEDKESGMTTKSEVSAKFKGDKVKNAKISYSIELTDDMKEYLDTFKSQIEKEYEEYNSDGIKANVSVDGNKITAVVKMNADKMTEEELDEQGVEGDYETIKTYFEELGFTCK